MGKKPIIKRLFSLLLCVVMLFGMFPLHTLAADNSYFYLVAEAEGRLVIAPERVYYEDAQTTIGQGLSSSGHTFTGLEQGWVTAINGIAAGYTRSDENGGYDLDATAASIRYFRFTDHAESAEPSASLQKLIAVMADYLEEDGDVKAAAKVQYEDAYDHFYGVSDENAEKYAVALKNAVEAYKESLSGVQHTVTFNISGASGAVTIEAENQFGKVFTNTDGAMSLNLPEDVYAFRVIDGYNRISGRIQVNGEKTVTAEMPSGEWLKTDTDNLKLSGSSGTDFEKNQLAISVEDGHQFRAQVSDWFNGAVYLYAAYNESLSDPVLTVLYTNSRGQTCEETVDWKSKYEGILRALASGPEGNTLLLRVSVKSTGGYIYSQDYTLELDRMPSLTGLKVADQKNKLQASTESFDGAVTEYTYRVLSTMTAAKITPTALDQNYTVEVNGEAVAQGDTCTVAMNTDESGAAAETTVTVSVRAGEYETVYKLRFVPIVGLKVQFNTASDTTLEVVNKNGDPLAFQLDKLSQTEHRYFYTLVPGETYTYVATKDTYYHASRAFTMEESAGLTITVAVPTENRLNGLALSNEKASSKRGAIPLEQSFDTARHTYTAVVSDTENAVYAWASPATGETTVRYGQIHNLASYDGKLQAVALDSEAKNSTFLPRALLSNSGLGNTLTFRVSETGTDGVEYYQDYMVTLKRRLSLQGLAVAIGKEPVTLVRPDDQNGFAAGVTEYTLSVPMEVTELVITIDEIEASRRYYAGVDDWAHHAAVNGEPVSAGDGRVTIALDGTSQPEMIEIEVTSDSDDEISTVYKLIVEKSAPVYTSIRLTPADALLTLHEVVTGNRNWPEDGQYMLSDGFSYAYTLTKTGYVGKSGTIAVTHDEAGAIVLDVDGVQVMAETIAGENAVELTFELIPAPENPNIDAEIKSVWSDFRGTQSNNAVTDVSMPIKAEESTLYWASKLGDGYSSGAVGCPIIVDGTIITYSGNKIYRIDPISGKTLESGDMVHSSAFSITPPTYYEGMIFVALADGTVQAFNADTLESLWVYKDPAGGQPNSPITVHNGYLYTGFWIGENKPAYFVCLPITDEDPTQTQEKKVAAWRHKKLGGFYWAGAYVCDEFVMVGTDDGAAEGVEEGSELLLLDPLTGAVLDRLSDLNSDIRCTISYDAVTNAYYFTSKGGTFYSVQVAETEDGPHFEKLKLLQLKNDGETPMSTSTPVVYNGRAYVGVSGDGQYAPYTGHNISVIDLKAWNIAYRVPTQGYPQTSGLLTTAYEAETGFVYVYFFDNFTPGKLRVFQDKAGQTTPQYLTQENGKQTPYVLFTPVGDHAQYAICSPIVDEYGTVYFKNDSAECRRP